MAGKHWLLVTLFYVFPAAADEDLHQRLQKVEQALARIESERATESSSQMEVYGSFRPLLTLEDDGQQSPALDVRDALSHIGLQGYSQVSDSAQGFFSGRWRVNIQDEGDIDGRQLAMVGLRKQSDNSNHQISMGTLRPPQYQLIAAGNDIFHNPQSPFAYAAISPFYIDNAMAYQMSYQDFQLYAALSSDGSSGEDVIDLLNYGISYQWQSIYLALALLEVTEPGIATDDPGDERQLQALAMSWTNEILSLAMAYQQFELMPEGVSAEFDGATLDLSLGYHLGNGKQLKSGYFEYEDGIQDASSLGYQGVNITFEQQLAANVLVHIELLYQHPYEADARTALSLGMRYDFSSSD